MCKIGEVWKYESNPVTLFRVNHIYQNGQVQVEYINHNPAWLFGRQESTSFDAGFFKRVSENELIKYRLNDVISVEDYTKACEYFRGVQPVPRKTYPNRAQRILQNARYLRTLSNTCGQRWKNAMRRVRP